MKRLTKLFLTGLMAGFFMTASAGPPPGGQGRMLPFQTYCHADELLMIKAVMMSFGQHISIVGSTHGGLTIHIFENPDEGTMSIMATSDAQPPAESCLIFSLKDVEHYVRPPVMPPRTNDEEGKEI